LFAPTHRVADAGMPTWPSPDASSAPGPRLDPALPVQLLEEYGNWARIACSNGWEAWVDGRRLLPTASEMQGQWNGQQRSAHQGTPIIAPIGQGAESTSPIGGDRLLVTASAVALAVCSFLPWIKTGRVSASSFKVKVAFLFDYKTSSPGGIKIGHLLLLLAVALFASSFVPALGAPSRAIGGVAAVIATVFATQVQRLYSQVPNGPSLFSTLGIGVYLTVVVGIAAALVPRPKNVADSSP
jgi:hypothetical protein